jgi:hypothetical protein
VTWFVHATGSSLGCLLMVACAAAAPPAPRSAPDSAARTPAGVEQAAEGGAAPSAEPPLPEGKYRIVWTRPDRVGARARVKHVTRDVRETRIVRGKRMVDRQSYARRVTLEAVAETLAVGADGRATKRRYQIEKVEADTAKRPRVIVPAGTEIVVTRAAGKRGTLHASSLALSEEDQRALEAVLPTTLGTTTEQQVFGSHQPRAIGDSWPIDGELARTMLDESGIRPSGAPRGVSRVLEKRAVGGEECLLILASLELDRFTPAEADPDAQLERASLRMRATSALPLDLRRPARTQTIAIEMQMVFSTDKGGDKLLIHVDSQREVTIDVQPL